MRAFFTLSACFVLSSCATTSTHSTATAARLEEVRTASRERQRIYATLDTLRLPAILADDFVAVIAGSTRDKSGALQAMREHDPRMPIDSITSDSVHIRVYGDVGIVTGINRLHMRDLRNNPPMAVIASNSATEVWHRRAARWVLVSTQQTFFDQKRTPLNR